MTTTQRVLARHLTARGQFDLAPVIAFLRADKPDEALEVLDTLMRKKLDVGVTRKREGFAVHTDWFHSLMPEDQRRYVWFLQTLANVRERLFEFTDEHDRRQSIEKSIDDLKDAVRDDVPWVESMMRGDEDAFKNGPYTIVLSPYVSRDAAEDCIKVLDAATAKVDSKFPQVTYGKVIVRRDPKPSGTYDKPGGGNIAGSYVAAGDYIILSLYATPTRDSVMTLIHELGHRYHTRFLDHEKRKQFIELYEVGEVKKEIFTPAEREKAADEMIALWKQHQQENYPDADEYRSPRTGTWSELWPRDEYKAKVLPLYRRFLEGDNSVEKALHKAYGVTDFPGNIVRTIGNPEPQYASSYGATSWEENFAECFLYHCIGKALPAALQSFMASL